MASWSPMAYSMAIGNLLGEIAQLGQVRLADLPRGPELMAALRDPYNPPAPDLFPPPSVPSSRSDTPQASNMADATPPQPDTPNSQQDEDGFCDLCTQLGTRNEDTLMNNYDTLPRRRAHARMHVRAFKYFSPDLTLYTVVKMCFPKVEFDREDFPDQNRRSNVFMDRFEEREEIDQADFQDQNHPSNAFHIDQLDQGEQIDGDRDDQIVNVGEWTCPDAVFKYPQQEEEGQKKVENGNFQDELVNLYGRGKRRRSDRLKSKKSIDDGEVGNIPKKAKVENGKERIIQKTTKRSKTGASSSSSISKSTKIKPIRRPYRPSIPLLSKIRRLINDRAISPEWKLKMPDRSRLTKMRTLHCHRCQFRLNLFSTKSYWSITMHNRLWPHRYWRSSVHNRRINRGKLGVELRSRFLINSKLCMHALEHALQHGNLGRKLVYGVKKMDRFSVAYNRSAWPSNGEAIDLKKFDGKLRGILGEESIMKAMEECYGEIGGDRSIGRVIGDRSVDGIDAELNQGAISESINQKIMGKLGNQVVGNRSMDGKIDTAESVDNQSGNQAISNDRSVDKVTANQSMNLYGSPNDDQSMDVQGDHWMDSENGSVQLSGYRSESSRSGDEKSESGDRRRDSGRLDDQKSESGKSGDQRSESAKSEEFHQRKSDRSSDHWKKDDGSSDQQKKPDQSGDHWKKSDQSTDQKKKPDGSSDYRRKSDRLTDQQKKSDGSSDQQKFSDRSVDQRSESGSSSPWSESVRSQISRLPSSASAQSTTDRSDSTSRPNSHSSITSSRIDTDRSEDQKSESGHDDRSMDSKYKAVRWSDRPKRVSIQTDRRKSMDDQIGHSSKSEKKRRRRGEYPEGWFQNTIEEYMDEHVDEYEEFLQSDGYSTCHICLKRITIDSGNGRPNWMNTIKHALPHFWPLRYNCNFPYKTIQPRQAMEMHGYELGEMMIHCFGKRADEVEENKEEKEEDEEEKEENEEDGEETQEDQQKNEEDQPKNKEDQQKNKEDQPKNMEDQPNNEEDQRKITGKNQEESQGGSAKNGNEEEEGGRWE